MIKGFLTVTIIIYSIFGILNIDSNIPFKDIPSYNEISPNEIIRIDKFLKEYEGYIGESEKTKIIEIKEKLGRYEQVTQEELDFIRNVELNIIKNILGDATFEEYIKLIKKRESNAEFTPPERFRLLQIEKQLKGVKK